MSGEGSEANRRLREQGSGRWRVCSEVKDSFPGRRDCRRVGDLKCEEDIKEWKDVK